MAKKVAIPWELKYKFAMGGYASGYKGWLYTVREEYGATAALKLYERVCKREDRIKNFTKSILTIFKIENNDAEAIGEWFDIWSELIGQEYTVLERNKTIAKSKITRCPYKVEYKDISDYGLIFVNIVIKTINPKATVERPKGMCAGDPYCEYVYKIEE